MNLDELRKYAQEAEQVHEEASSNFNLGGLLLAGTAALAMGTPVRSMLKRVEFSVFGSLLETRWGRKLLSRAGVEASQKGLEQAFGTIGGNYSKAGSSIFLRSIEKMPDITLGGFTRAAGKKILGADAIKKIDDFPLDIGALSMESYLAFRVASTVTGQRDNDQGYFKYAATIGPMIAGMAFGYRKAGDMVQEVLKRTGYDEVIAKGLSKVKKAGLKVTAFRKAIREASSSGISLGRIIKGAPGEWSRLKGLYRQFAGEMAEDDIVESTDSLRQLISVARKYSSQVDSAGDEAGKLYEMFEPAAREIEDRFQVRSPGLLNELLGLKTPSVEQIIKQGDVISEDNVKALRRFSKVFGVDLSKVSAGEGISMSRAGSLLPIASGRRRTLDMFYKAATSFHIPYLNFNPLAIFQPRLFREYARRPVYGVMDAKEAIPYIMGGKSKSGTIGEFSYEYLQKLGILKSGKEAEGALLKAATRSQLHVSGGRSFLSVDLKDIESFLDTDHAGKQARDMLENALNRNRGRLVVDVTEHFGEGYLLPKSDVGGAFARSYYMQSGMLLPGRQEADMNWWQRADLPFTNTENIEEPIFKRFYKSIKRFVGGSKLKRALAAAGGHAGKTTEQRLNNQFWGAREIYKLFRQMGIGDIPEDVIQKISRNIGDGPIEFGGIKNTQDIVNSFYNYLRTVPRFRSASDDVAKLFRTVGPTDYEWHIYRELKHFKQTGMEPNREWLDAIISSSGESRLDIMKRSVTMGLLQNVENPEQVIKGMAGSYNKGFIDNLLSMAEYAKRERAVYSAAIGEMSASKATEQILDMGGIQRFYGSIKSRPFSPRWFKNVRIMTAYEQVPEERAKISSANVNLFIRRTQGPFSTKEGFAKQLLPTTDTRASTTIPGVLGFYFADRPVQLLEEIGLGRPSYDRPGVLIKLLNQLGFKQAGKFVGPNALYSISSVIFKRVMPVFFAYELFKYLDYKTEQLMGESPSDLAVEGAKKVIEGLNIAAEKVGMVGAMEYMHNYLPGLLPLATGMAASYAAGPFGFFMGAGAGALAENMPRAKETILEFEGMKDVDVRRGRYWHFGVQPFVGGKVVTRRPHLMHLAQTDWQYTDVLWGSKKEYWQHRSWMPTPENLFGLKKVLQPYYFEKKNQYMRPYPVTGESGITDFPIVGNLAAPLASAMKPLRKFADISIEPSYGSTQKNAMQVGSMPGFSLIEAKQRQTDERTGILPYPQIDYAPEIESALAGQVRNAVDDVADYLGLFGFMGANVLGFNTTPQSEEPRLAHSGLAYSRQWQYYRMQLGDPFGNTELLRRFIVRTNPTYTLDYINPVPNEYFKENFPWLPKDYYYSFYQGDVYRKIGAYGEVRGPGPGYEATHKLYDNYGMIDRYLIMSNIAPYSREQQYLEKDAVKLMRSDQVSPEVRYRLYEAKLGAEDMREKYNFKEKVFSKKLETTEVTLGSYLGSGQFEMLREGEPTGIKVRVAGLAQSAEQIAAKIYETQLGVSSAEAFGKAERYMEDINQKLAALSGKTVDVRVAADESERFVYRSSEDITMPAIFPQMSGMMRSRQELTQKEKHWMDRRAVLGDSVVGALWEDVAHANVFFMEKFAGVQSPEEYYKRYVTYGKERRLWQHPIEDFVKPVLSNIAASGPLDAMLHGGYLGLLSAGMGNRIFGTMLGGAMGLGASIATPPGWVPNKTKERWALEARMDAMQTIRNEYTGERERTMLGADHIADIENASYRLPRVEREFFEEFVNAPISKREELMNITPPYMQAYLKHFWQLKDVSVEAKLNKGTIPQNAYEIDLSEYREYTDSVTGNYDEALVSNPLIDLDKYRALQVVNNFSDYTKFGVYADEITSAKTSLIDMEKLYGEQWNQHNQLLTSYVGLQDIAAMNNGYMSKFSIAPHYDGVNLVYNSY